MHRIRPIGRLAEMPFDHTIVWFRRGGSPW